MWVLPISALSTLSMCSSQKNTIVGGGLLHFPKSQQRRHGQFVNVLRGCCSCSVCCLLVFVLLVVSIHVHVFAMISSPEFCRTFCGRLIFMHLQCWEVLPFCRFQCQRCIKVRILRAQDFYTPLALKTAKGQHLPALEVYKNQSPISGSAGRLCGMFHIVESLLKNCSAFRPCKFFSHASNHTN